MGLIRRARVSAAACTRATEKRRSVLTRSLLALSGAAILLFPSLSGAQTLAREALSSFPADTEQLAFTSLADLRNLSNYAQIRRRIFPRELRNFEDFVRSMGIDPEKDIDEVVVGWRGQKLDRAAFFGIADGRFQPETARDFFTRNQLPIHDNEGRELYVYGSGVDSADLYFTFLTSSLAAFGRLNDLKALLDARTNMRSALYSSAAFVNREAELEGTAPQWGIISGRAVAAQGVSWLSPGPRQTAMLSALLGPIEAILYRVDCNDGFSTHLSILCQRHENAEALAKLLTLWRDFQQPPPTKMAPGIVASLSELDVRVDGSRVEISAFGPLELIESFPH